MKNNVVGILLIFLGIKVYSQQTVQAPARGLSEVPEIGNFIDLKDYEKKMQASLRETLQEYLGRKNVFSLNELLYVKYQFIFKTRNPVSCSVFKKRLSLYQTKVSELNDYLKSRENKSILSQSETKNIQNIATEIIPSIVSPDEEYVELKVKWSRDKISESPIEIPEWSEYLIQNGYYEPISLQQFQIFHLEGPGLKWDGESGEETSFLKLTVNGDIELSYKMTIFDLCLGQNNLRIDSLGFGGDPGKTYHIKLNWDLNRGYGPFYGRNTLQED